MPTTPKQSRRACPVCAKWSRSSTFPASNLSAAVPRGIIQSMQGLRTEALAVLRNNDAGDSTKPAPRLYPHQWSWDSAFISIGLAHVDLDRALRELESLFAAQWSDGRVPHIVFNPTVMD